jgi:type II secretory pathway pseudopilin PulG
MIVVAILAILVVVAIPKFSTIVDRARESATKGDLASLRAAILEYYSMTEGYLPRSLDNIPYTYEIAPKIYFTVSFLPSDKFKGFFPACVNDPTRPKAFTRFRKGIGQIDNKVVVIDPETKIFYAGKKGGWLYFGGDSLNQSKKVKVIAISSDGQTKERYLQAGEVCINNCEKDSTGKFYIEY